MSNDEWRHVSSREAMSFRLFLVDHHRTLHAYDVCQFKVIFQLEKVTVCFKSAEVEGCESM